MTKLSSIKHYALSSAEAAVKSHRVSGKPVVLTIEPTNTCNLRCPVCETGAGLLRRPRGMMSDDDFSRVLDNVGKQVNQILIYFMGEPCLNENVYAMLGEARRRGIYASVCTNGQVPNSGSRLLSAGANEVSFQIGGTNQETHEKYRVRGDLITTIGSIRQAVAAKDWKYRDVRLKAGLIVMKHNEHEVAAFPEWCRKLGVEPEIINPCVRDRTQAAEYLPDDQKYWLYDPTALANGELRMRKPNHNRCLWIYYSAVICWNGDVVPCCRDANGEHVMGNILRDDFDNIWNGEKYREFRRRVATDQKHEPLCRLCSGFGVPRLK